MLMNRFQKLVSLIMINLLVLSAFVIYIPTNAFARGVATGSSGSIDSTTARSSPAGGIANLDGIAFRISAIRDGRAFNTGSNYESKLASKFIQSLPDTQNGLLFLPKNQDKGNYEVGSYDPSGRRILKYNSGSHYTQVYELNDYRSSVTNYGKRTLAKYNSSGSKGFTEFGSLTNGKWKSKAKKISKTQAKEAFEYILKPNNGSTSSGGYDITNRMNKYISKHASVDNIKNLTGKQADDVKRGWLGLMFAAYQLTDSRGHMRTVLEVGIEDFLKNKNQTEDGKPIALVVDTSTTIKWTASPKRLIIPTTDYLEYYAAIGSAYTLIPSTPRKGGGSSTYSVVESLYTKDIQAKPNQWRTSGNFDKLNPFSWGATATLGKGSRLISNKDSKKFYWSSDGVHNKSTIMDSLEVSGGGTTVYGFNIANFSSLPVKPDINGDFPTLKATGKLKVPAKQTKLKSTNDLSIKFKMTDSAKNTWDMLKAQNPGMNNFKVKIFPNRKSKEDTAIPKYRKPPKKQTEPKWYASEGHTVNSYTKYKKLLGGTTMRIDDNVSKTPIANGQKIKYTYSPKIRVVYNAYGVQSTLYAKTKTRSLTYSKGKPPKQPNVKFTLEAKINGKKEYQSKPFDEVGVPVDLVVKSKTPTDEADEFANLVNDLELKACNDKASFQVTFSRKGGNKGPDLSNGEDYKPSGTDYEERQSISIAEAIALVKGSKTYTLQDEASITEFMGSSDVRNPLYTATVTLTIPDGCDETSYESTPRDDVVITTPFGECDPTKEDCEQPPNETPTGDIPPVKGCPYEDNSEISDDGKTPANPDCPDDPPEEGCTPGVTATSCEVAEDDKKEEEIVLPKMEYASVPSNYTEVKENIPDSENFDAMAGTPSTQQFYYAIGGSEFIVDVEFEYIQDATSVWRTYKSKFDGVASEFKDGDNAKTGQIQEHTVNLHDGGTYSHDWSGSIPNKGVATTATGDGEVTATSVAVPDMSDYQAKLKKAQEYVDKVNNTELCHMSASDKFNYCNSEWSPKLTEVVTPPENTTAKGGPSYKKDCTTDKDGKESCVNIGLPVTATAQPAPAGTYSINVTFKVPKDIICGPECRYDLPSIEDTWKQKISYDYMKIIRANVFELKEGLLEDVGEYSADSEMRTSRQRGDYHLFSNIAQMNAVKIAKNDTFYDKETTHTRDNGQKPTTGTFEDYKQTYNMSANRSKWEQSSTMGRIRYSVEEKQDDAVIWEEGVRDNFSAGEGSNFNPKAPQGGGHSNTWSKKGILYNNPNYTDEKDYHVAKGGMNTATSEVSDSLDMATKEWKKFDERRKTPVTASIISDMIILQTSEGDQPVFYSHTDSTAVQTQEQFPDVEITKESLWEGNSNRNAINWKPDEILVGSYNGFFEKSGTSSATNQKYWAYSQAKQQLGPNGVKIPTRFDDNAVGVHQSEKRKADGTRVYHYGTAPIIRTTPNGRYTNGNSTAFYEEKIDWLSPDAYLQYDGKMETTPPLYDGVEEGNFNNVKGLIFPANYSDAIGGTNSIVIHTPVSVQYAEILALPAIRDQRVNMPPGGAKDLIHEQNVQAVKDATSAQPFEYEDYYKKNVKTTVTENTKETTKYASTQPVSETFLSNEGKLQTFVAPYAGNYTITAKGAQGGENLTRSANHTGGKGGLAKGTVKLSKGQKVFMFVGKRGESSNGTIDKDASKQAWGGYHNGGYGTGSAGVGGGGSTDIMIENTDLVNRILVAGGGGGGDDPNPSSSTEGFEGGNTTNLVTATVKSNFGENGVNGLYNNTYPYDNAGGGGGYFGGKIKQGDDMISAYGGSNHIDTTRVTNSSTQAGVNSGDGSVVIESVGGVSKPDYVYTYPTKTTKTEDLEDEGGEKDGYRGYLWQDLLGSNWKSYFTDTTETVKNSKETVIEETRLVNGSVESVKKTTIGENGQTTVDETTPIKEGQYANFGFTGGVQQFTIPKDGMYQLEVWGAEGGGSESSGNINSGTGGKGGYSKGLKQFSKGDVVQVFVGGRGGSSTNGLAQGGFNGGGNGYASSDAEPGNGGGGATDIRLGSASLTDRIIVAGGGGGGGEDTNDEGGHGGGLSGVGGIGNNATQTGAGLNGSLGIGASTVYGDGGGGGGGYYGGGSTQSSTVGSDTNGGGGGSGYVGKVQQGTTSAGNTTIPNPTYKGTTTGNSGTGYARITYTSGSLVDTSSFIGESTLKSSGSVKLASAKAFSVASENTTYTAPTTGVYNLELFGAQGGTTDGVLDESNLGSYAQGTILLKEGEKLEVNLGEKGTPVSDTKATNGETSTITLTSGEDKTLMTVKGGEGTSSTTGNTVKVASVMSNTNTEQGVSTGSARAVITPLAVTSTDEVKVIVKTTVTETTGTVFKRVMNRDLIQRDIDTFPDYMPDKSYNPIKRGFGVAPDTDKLEYDSTILMPDGKQFDRGDFINIDYGFQVYYPNVGDFAQQPNLLGIADVTATRGLGYTTPMDVTKYTDNKQMKFAFAVIYNGHSYPADTWIDVPVEQTLFDLYSPLGNPEAAAASVEFQSAPINGMPTGTPTNTNYETVTNKDRLGEDLAAEHGAYKKTFIDMVGRIGNLAVDDTDDFRFSNLFKQSVCTTDCKITDWIVDGIVKKTDDSKQKGYYTDSLDIRGDVVTDEYALSTWGTQNWTIAPKRYKLPINPKDNSHKALKEEFLRPGYDIINEISTIGNYQQGVLKVLPYYYKLDIETGEVIPLDVYQYVNGEFQLINEYKGADDGVMPNNLVEFNSILDWQNEYARRNYGIQESEITDRVSKEKGEGIMEYIEVEGMSEKLWGVVGYKALTVPKGNFSNLGNAQQIAADYTARTFIGSTFTNGNDRNPEKYGMSDYNYSDEELKDWENIKGALRPVDYEYGAQRWHLKLSTPSSTRFVEHGKEPNLENTEALKKTAGVVLLATDITSIGDTWTLQYTQFGVDSIPVTKEGKSRTFNIAGTGIPTVIALLDLDYTSYQDVSIQGSH